MKILVYIQTYKAHRLVPFCYSILLIFCYLCSYCRLYNLCEHAIKFIYFCLKTQYFEKVAHVIKVCGNVIYVVVTILRNWLAISFVATEITRQMTMRRQSTFVKTHTSNSLFIWMVIKHLRLLNRFSSFSSVSTSIYL